MDEAAFAKWREVAKASAWKDYEEKVKNGKQPCSTWPPSVK